MGSNLPDDQMQAKETEPTDFPFGPPPEEVEVTFSDSTIRDLFAAAAFQGMLSDPKADPTFIASVDEVAVMAYGYADAMIEARKK